MTFRRNIEPFLSRNSHTILHNGPGSIIRNNTGVSMLVYGLSEWKRGYLKSRTAPLLDEVIDELVIHDTFLEQKLGIQKIIAPPKYDNNERSQFGWFIPAIRYPIAQYCTYSKCRKIDFDADYGDPKEGRCTKCKSKRQPLRQIPLLFCCIEGHLEEPSWSIECHKGQDCALSNLIFKPEPYLKNSTITCTNCGKSIRISEIPKKKCTGNRPWLQSGESESPECENLAEIIEAPSSNSYFPWAEVSIVVPPKGELIPAVLSALRTSRDIKTLRTSGWKNNKENLESIQKMLKMRTIDIDIDLLIKHLEALDKPKSRPDDEKKQLESSAFVEARSRGEAKYGLPDLIVEPFDPTSIRIPYKSFSIKAASSITRLRAISVLTGFSRIKHAHPDRNIGLAQLWGTTRQSSSDGHTFPHSWLYGTEQFGEGIYLEFPQSAIPTESELSAFGRNGLSDIDIQKTYVHTLSHLLLRVCAERSGFNLPSLRERLYLGQDSPGILIYTTSPSIEGTSGGLASLGDGENLGKLLTAAIELATWCTSDPVCLEGNNFGKNDEKERGSCHHCVVVPETSCENGNEFLDRMVIIAKI